MSKDGWKYSESGLWSYSEGRRPNTVRVFQRTPGGVFYSRVWDSKLGYYVKASLKHRDKAKAEIYAAKQYAKLVAGEKEIEEGRTTIGRLFSLYLEHKTPSKSKSEQKADKRRAEMWLRVLGSATDAHGITSRAWDGFIRDRRSGAVDARGRPVAESKACPSCKGRGDDCERCEGSGRVSPRREVGDRTIEADCLWLRWVFNWGVNERTGAGAYLLTENCVRGLAVPHEKNPKRPVATRDRFEAIRAATDDVITEIRWEGRCDVQRSWLTEVFDLAMATGRRITAICSLRYDDLQLERGPHGFVRWRADTDKGERETVVPIDEEARAAIDRQLARRNIVGRAYLFPSPTDPSKAMTRHLADKWLRQAEELAEVEPQDGSLWHAYRRGWATARKNLSTKDVAKLGGWSRTETLEEVYQQADLGTMLEIVSTKHELREAR